MLGLLRAERGRELLSAPKPLNYRLARRCLASSARGGAARPGVSAHPNASATRPRCTVAPPRDGFKVRLLNAV